MKSDQMFNKQKFEYIKNNLKIYGFNKLQFSSRAVSLTMSILQWDTDDTEIKSPLLKTATRFTHCQECLPS